MHINFCLLFLTTILLQADANHFTFDASTQMSSAENWLHEEIPCIGDEIRFDSSMPVVAFMDHNVNVESIYLPKNGIIVFTDNGIDLGGDSNWQCAKDHLKQPEQKFYTSEDRHDTSFYNPKNWIPDKRFFLHMNQVPCEYDDVTVSSMSSAQIYLDLPVKVNRFRYYKRSGMTTEDFNVLLRSMEGQFQLNLARPWAHESDQGGVQRLIADDAITVKNKNLVDEKTGRINSNSNPEILKKICSYVHCEGVEDQCIDSFVPFGHCCPVCGTRINFYAVDLNITAAKYEFFLAMKRLENSPEVFGTLEKTAKDSLGAEYEIAIINTHNSTYDEDFHKLAEKEMAKELLKLLSKQLTSFGTIKTFSSRIDRTIKTSSKIVASLIYFTVIVVLVGMYAYQYGDFRLPRATVFTPVIRYKRQEDDVAIEMEGGADEGEEEQEVSEIQSEPEEPAVRREEVEDVEDWRNINPNFALASSADNAGMDFEMTETMKSEEPEVQEEHQDGKEDSVQDKLIGIEEVDSQDAENGQNDPENPVQEVMEDLKDEEKPDDTEFGDINPNFESESELDIDSVSPELQNLSESESSSTTDAKSDDVANHKTDDGSSDENTDLLDF